MTLGKSTKSAAGLVAVGELSWLRRDDFCVIARLQIFNPLPVLVPPLGKHSRGSLSKLYIKVYFNRVR